MKLDKDNWQERDKILKIAGEKASGGTVRFDNLTIDSLNELIEKNFIELEECQNCSPTVEEIKDFMTEHPDFTAHGYAVVPERDDYRVSIEGVELDRKPTSSEMTDFVALFRFADEFTCDSGGCYSWYD